MSQPSHIAFVITQSLDSLLNQRKALFDEMENLNQHAKKSSQNAAEEGKDAAPEKIPMLTTSQTPPDEITQADKIIKGEILSIQTIFSQVADAEKEIEEIDALNKNLLIGIAIVLGILILVVMQG